MMPQPPRSPRAAAPDETDPADSTASSRNCPPSVVKNSARSRRAPSLVEIKTKHSLQCTNSVTISSFAGLIAELNAAREDDGRTGNQRQREDRIDYFRQEWYMGALSRARPLALLADGESEVYSDGQTGLSSAAASSTIPSVLAADSDDEREEPPPEARDHLLPPDPISRGLVAERTLKRHLARRNAILRHADLASLAAVARKAMRRTLRTGQPVYVAPGLIDSVDWTDEYRARGWARPGIRWSVFRPDLIRFQETKAGSGGERAVSWEVVEIKYSNKPRDFIYTNFKIQAIFYHLSLARILSNVPSLVPSHKVTFCLSRDPLSPRYEERSVSLRTEQAFVEHHLFVLLPTWLEAVKQADWDRLQAALGESSSGPVPATPDANAARRQTFIEKLQASIKVLSAQPLRQALVGERAASLSLNIMAPDSPTDVTLADLTELLTTHHDTLARLYGALSPAPRPLVAAHLAQVHRTVSSVLAEQVTAAESRVAAAEAQLAAGWKRVHEWQTALGEPLRAAKRRGDGPLEALVEEVDRVKEGMKGRMAERGRCILELQARIRQLADLVGGGNGWLAVSLEPAAEEGRWEDLDLTQDRMVALEGEILRCEAEITHRKELLDSDAKEVYALRCELGLDVAGAAGTATGDPFDEDVLWHLGVGEGRAERRELQPTAENVRKLEEKRRQLEEEKDSRNETIQTTYDKLYPLWTMLGVTEEEMDDFVNRHMGSTLDVVQAYQNELARMLAMRRTNLSAFIQRERETMTELWDRLYTSYPQRLVEFPAYSISVEPSKEWNAALGRDELVVSDNVSEELLEAHERERERLEREVADAGPMLDKLQRYFGIVELKKQLEVSASDPSRLTDKSRGAAARLAQEAKDRNRVDREKPKLEAELRRLIPQWEAQHGRPYLVNGVSFIEGLDEQIRAEEQEKENRKRAKLGASISAGAVRPIRAQHTGAAPTTAPLKRQMTGASARSATSATAVDAPAPKRFAGGGVAPTPSAGRIARPKSALGDANGSAPTPHGSGSGGVPASAAAAKPLRAQVTGIGRPRAGTVAQTPMTGSRTAPFDQSSSLMASVGPGMRLPAGWGAAAHDSPSIGLGGGSGAAAAHNAGAGAARPNLVPQPTGSFRPTGR